MSTAEADQLEAMQMGDKIVVMNHGVIEQFGAPQDIYDKPATLFVADFIGNNNMFKGTIRSHSGSMVFVEADEQLYYIRVPDHIRQVTVGREVHFSVRADLMHTGDKREMANKVRGSYVATEFLGTLETDVFEVGPNHFVHVEQHRHLSDTSYKVGEMETLCFTADSGMLLAENRRPEDVTG